MLWSGGYAEQRCYNSAGNPLDPSGTMPTTDVLVLAVARQPGGLMIAGMTTERDPVTGLRWVRSTMSAPLALDDLRYADGTFVRPGDVVRLATESTESPAPHVESVALDLEAQPVERVRQLSDERRAGFFPAHLDTDPAAVLRERTRSLCLIRPDYAHAIISFDEETGRFETRLALMSGKLRSNDEGIAVADIYWRALARTWLGDEPYVEIDDADLQARLGDMYVVIGLNRKSNPLILGVHTVPPYETTLDEDAL